MDNIIIEVKNLFFSFEDGKQQVLKNINMNIKKGEYIAIVGHNGSGKSTLAKQLNALITPVSGNVLVDGLDTKDINNHLNIRKKVGMVFQNPDNQLVATLVEEDVAFAPENIGVKRDELRRRVDYSLKAVDMYDYKDKAPSNLSGGQKQRVAIAGILAMDPDCIVLDESTAMLDPKGREEVINVISQLNKEKNKTIVNITHFMEEAATADRIIVMNKGEIAMDGKPYEVFSRVDELIEMGLDVPQLTSFGVELNKLNFINKDTILTKDEAISTILEIVKGEK